MSNFTRPTSNYTKNSAESYSHCPFCKNINLVRQTGEDEPTSHYGRLKCGDCGKHIQWLKDPSTCMATMQRNNAIVELFKKAAYLSDWEEKFLRSIKDKRYLTDKQRTHLDRIGRRVLRVQICAPNSGDLLKSPSQNPDREARGDLNHECCDRTTFNTPKQNPRNLGG